MIVTVVIMILCVVLDQVTKIAAVEKLAPIGTFPLIQDIFHFTYVENRGAAFGMLADHRWVFMILSTAAIAAMLVWLFIEKPKSWWIRISTAFVIAGGIGNMIDRIGRGYVVDFIDCRFIDFYVFNVADSFVCVGCGMFLAAALYAEIVESRKKKAQAAEAAESGDGGSDE